MKKIFFFIALLSMPLLLFAQTQTDIQKQIQDAQEKLKQIQSNPKIQQAMKKAQQAMQQMNSNPEMKKEMSQNNTLMDSMKKSNPALANINMPGFSSMQSLNLDSLNNQLSIGAKQMQALSPLLTSLNVFKTNPLHHAEKLPQLNSISINVSVKNILKKVNENLGSVKISLLNKLTKDPKVNIASVGALLLTTGGDPNAALYLICNAIIKKPQDPWGVNDLGIYYRYTRDYKNALECFFYANKLDTGKSATINTNIGWAAAFYGDLDAAIKYFSNALSVDKDFSSANEGEATVYYSEGNISALWKALVKGIKKIKIGSGILDDGLSDDFASTCATAAVQSEENLDNQSSDPNDDHTFDNPNPEDNDSPDPPPGAFVDDIQYSRYKKVFVNDSKQILSAISSGIQQNIKTFDILKSARESIMQELKSLKPLVQTPYKDDAGDLIIPNNFKKYVDLFTAVSISFEKRRTWYINKLNKKLKDLLQKVMSHNDGMWDAYVHELLACGGQDDACAQRVECKWIPVMYKSENNDLDIVARDWEDYYDNTTKVIQWYLDASAPFISRVHDVGWNNYLNDERELNVRTAIIAAYNWWITGLKDIGNPNILSVISKPAPTCPPPPGPQLNSPDPFSKKPKRIKEFEGKCYSTGMSLVIVGFKCDCHQDMFYVGTPPGELNPLPISLGAFYSETTDQIAAQNQGYSNQVGGSLEVGPSIGVMSAGVYGSGDLRFDNNWQLTGGNTSAGGELDAFNHSINYGPQTTLQVVAGQEHLSSGMAFSHSVH